MDTCMPDPRKASSELSEILFIDLCWNLRRAIQALIEAISSKIGKCK